MNNIRYRSIFLDANVILDYVLKRKYHFENAKSILVHAAKLSVNLYVCSYTFAIVYHFLRDKNFSHKNAINVLENLYQSVKCLPVDDNIIKKAMRSDFRDFEDAIQYCSALQIADCEAIITRNPKDFAASNVFVATPQKFLTHLIK